jgi:hypothetical protein
MDSKEILNTNIYEVKKLVDLKNIIKSNTTVIIGFTLNDTPTDLKITIRKFLKRKSKSFPLIKFIYMEVNNTDRNTLNILQGEDESFPKIFHIRNGDTILCQVDAATEESIYESFGAVEKYYIDEMKNNDINSNEKNNDIESQKDIQKDTKENVDPVLEKKKTLEMLVLLNKKATDMKLGLLHNVAKRKKIEKEIEKNKKQNEEDPKEYRRKHKRT